MSSVEIRENEVIEAAMRTLYPTGSRSSFKVPPSRWTAIYEMRRAGRSSNTIAKEEGCSRSWIRDIVRAMSLAYGTYAPDAWMTQLREMQRESRAGFREHMANLTERDAVELQTNQAIRAGLPPPTSSLPAKTRTRTGWDPAVHGKGCW